MKTALLNTRFLLLAATACALGFARPAAAADKTNNTDGQPVCVDKVADFTYVVRVSNPSQKASQLWLERVDTGARLYRSSDKAPSFGRKLNVKNLEDGQYAIVVQTGKATRRYTLELATQPTQRVALLHENAVAAR
ncbi:hypothetical protein [Hymenobacter edaphi]|uniref:Secretion system C-terminal sorting domain-containing protein n=1 Tax=Hymenobacter edaphi TaxID=2211146 RepID=A0A328B7Q3_9BACT|nr:hypothetical protein [Hymenobacter edaphi]RAK62675.1 hypothetical protein DLM85_22670 [Hymenobacter edaphi]